MNLKKAVSQFYVIIVIACGILSEQAYSGFYTGAAIPIENRELFFLSSQFQNIAVNSNDTYAAQSNTGLSPVTGPVAIDELFNFITPKNSEGTISHSQLNSGKDTLFNFYLKVSTQKAPSEMVFSFETSKSLLVEFDEPHVKVLNTAMPLRFKQQKENGSEFWQWQPDINSVTYDMNDADDRAQRNFDSSSLDSSLYAGLMLDVGQYRLNIAANNSKNNLHIYGIAFLLLSLTILVPIGWYLHKKKEHHFFS